MTKTIKIGGLTVEVPDDSPLASGPVVESPAALVAEKPDEPEKLATLEHVYRPNDPFQSSVDRVVALGNAHATGKSWVRKTFLVCLVILPFTFIQIAAIGALFNPSSTSRLSDFLFVNFLGLFVWVPGLLIWRAKRPKKPAS
jgi:hypothetical protein